MTKPLPPDYKAAQLGEVGEKFSLTQERIRQIEYQTLKRLRLPNHARLFRDYLSQ